MTLPQVLTPEQEHAFELAARGELAREAFDLEAYENFHWCIFQHDLEPHERKNLGEYFDEWNKPKAEGQRGVLNKASRGFFKSTDSAGFVLFVTGHFPYLSNLILQARNEDAEKTGRLFADTIESNAGWKACFPNIVPDPDRGWSLRGYHVKDTSVPYPEWVQKVQSDHKRDPSFMAVSVMAGAIGMHPTGCLLLDDVHDSKNTESLAEMSMVIKTVRADIIPTMNRPGVKPMMIVAYTPWKVDDTYAVLEQTGIFRQLVTPAYVEVSDAEYRENDPNYAIFDGQKIRLTCARVYGIKELEQQYRILGKREFSRQLLCRLDVGKGEVLPFYGYTTTGNEFNYPMTGGADPTGAEPDKLDEGKKRSYFALAFVAKLPQGGALVYDGVLEQCSHLEAENHIFAAQNRFPQWSYTMVEMVGPGLVFYQNARRNPNLKLIPSDVTEIDEKDRRVVRSKDDRILQMAKWFEVGIVRIANLDTPFLNMLRYLFEHFWELNKNTPHPAWDAGDATYHALKGIPEVLQMAALPDELPQPEAVRQSYGLGSAWGSLGRN